MKELHIKSICKEGDNHQLFIEVKDQGIGISVENQEKILKEKIL